MMITGTHGLTAAVGLAGYNALWWLWEALCSVLGS